MSENNPLSLLYEVRKDALAKAKGMEVDERFWCMIYHMGRMIQETQKEGLLALDERIKAVPAQIGFGQDMQLAALYVCDALDAEVITEMLTARYWVKDLQGKDALLYFMMILSFLKIQDGSSRYVLENLLLAYLPDDAWEQFAAFKKQYQPPEPTLAQRLLNTNASVGKGGILYMKQLLETKIEQADRILLKKVIKAERNHCFVISLKGLSSSAKKKLFSVIPEHQAEEYAQEAAYMGPVRQLDVMMALAEMAAVFDGQET